MNLEHVKNFPSLSERFNLEGHWHTSYPSLGHWTDFSNFEYRQRLAAFARTRKPLHLYIHIPFCRKLCFYCICSILITSDRQKIQFFLDYLFREIDLLREFYDEIGEEPQIEEIHFGGGTPSYLDRGQFESLCNRLRGLSGSHKGNQWASEVAMEVDPRTVEREDLGFYASQGVTRVSFGIQDFDPSVQRAINREQPYEMIEELMKERHHFQGINFDLLYGLPKQTFETINDTLDKTLKLSPDRITLLKYCHAPDVRRHMKLINTEDLPNEEDLPIMFCEITQRLTESGYKWIGLDHFAKPTDSLASGRLYRTFNGFTPGRTHDMVGLGPTTTAAFGETYCQSIYDLPGYYKAIDEGKFPVFRGYKMTPDDLLRREVIFSLLCNQEVDLNKYGSYFDRERKLLYGLPELCHVRDGVVRVNTVGRVLLRNVCKVFDVKDVEKKHFRIAQLNMTRRVA